LYLSHSLCIAFAAVYTPTPRLSRAPPLPLFSLAAQVVRLPPSPLPPAPPPPAPLAPAPLAPAPLAPAPLAPAPLAPAPLAPAPLAPAPLAPAPLAPAPLAPALPPAPLAAASVPPPPVPPLAPAAVPPLALAPPPVGAPAGTGGADARATSSGVASVMPAFSPTWPMALPAAASFAFNSVSPAVRSAWVAPACRRGSLWTC